MDTTHAMDPSGAPLGSPLGGRGTGSGMPEESSFSPSGVGVIDKASLILDALEAGAASLADLVETTGLARPTAHRLAVALAHHRFVGRDVHGRFVLGSRLVELASAAGEDRLISAAAPVLLQLRDSTGESSQVFRRQGEWRVCVASAERPIGLREHDPREHHERGHG